MPTHGRGPAPSRMLGCSTHPPASQLQVKFGSRRDTRQKGAEEGTTCKGIQGRRVQRRALHARGYRAEECGRALPAREHRVKGCRAQGRRIQKSAPFKGVGTICGHSTLPHRRPGSASSTTDGLFYHWWPLLPLVASSTTGGLFYHWWPLLPLVACMLIPGLPRRTVVRVRVRVRVCVFVRMCVCIACVFHSTHITHP